MLSFTIRVASNVAFLFAIIISVPLAFDVGGRACGLAYSLSLATFYFFHSIFRLLTPDRSRWRYGLLKLVGLLQYMVMPILLIWALNRFSVDTDDTAGWVERTFTWTRRDGTTLQQWITGPDGLAEAATIGVWDKVLRWSTPFFQLCEGFCSLLVIQAAGQITRWLVNRSGRSDAWMVSPFS
jgi:hypothetical protein